MNRASKGYQTALLVRHRVLGAAFLALLVFFGWLTYALFTQKFTDFAEVTLKSSSIGLQLPANADVKIRGVIVGQVRDVRAGKGDAVLTLGIYPSELDTIPADTTARILPKTLFGEKYVALQVPDQPSRDHLEAGAVITESKVAIEVERVLSDIYPLLRAVQPAQINYTLTALADALEGRGDRIGENLSVLDDYLRRTNPKLPKLIDDIKLLGGVSDTYSSVVPELANLLRNSVRTGHTFIDKEAKIKALFTDVASFSSTTRDFLQKNGQNIIRLSELGQAQLPMLARYAPVYPCLLKGIVGLIPRESEAFRGHTLHINLETLPRQPRGYTAADAPRYAEHRGPNCVYLPGHPFGQQNLPPDSVAPDLADGVGAPLGKRRTAPSAAIDLTSGYAGTRAEADLVDAFAAPVLGVEVDDVPGLTALLVGPLARGTEVSLQ